LFYGQRGADSFNWLAFFFALGKMNTMKLYLKAALITSVVGLVLVGLFWQWSRSTLPSATQAIVKMDEMETVGIPNFLVKDLEGKTVQLKDFQGQVVIISFWASWCGPCLEEFPSMIELVEKMKGQVKLMAISQDSERSEIDAFLRAFPKSKHPDIFILWDQDHAIGKQFGVERLPESYVAGKDHKLVRKIVGSINWATEDAIGFMRELVDKK